MSFRGESKASLTGWQGDVVGFSRRACLYNEARRSTARKLSVDQLSQEEQDRRRESWRQANASIRIEGGTISPEFRALQERHIRGEMTREELEAEMDRLDREDTG
ncbi:antitoxin VbhA family protein [Thioclava sp. ES.031]|uniref:antitoxin VbhA family protein n=1 Tax=Thioclava sp. ES.031 TaxID=1798203 RepID=UPI0034E97961